MTEYTLRDKCQRCDGVGGWMSKYPPTSGKWEYCPLGILITCYVCDGSGLEPWSSIKTLELI